MDYKSFNLILLFCVAGAAADMENFPTQPIGVTVGSRHVITCSVRDDQNQATQWLHNGDVIYNSLSGVDPSVAGLYDIEKNDVSNPKIYNLVILSATRELAGTYKCLCAAFPNAETDVSVLVFDEPMLNPTTSGQLIAGQEEIMRCEVVYGAEDVINGDEQAFELNILDGEGVQVTDVNTNVWEVDPATIPPAYRRFINTTMLTLDWQDDGQEYACVIAMTEYSENTTVSLNVLHAASNITLSPYDADMAYYKTETVTAMYSADPTPHRWVWSRMVDGVWQVIDDDDDQERTLVIGNWPFETTLKVDVLNTFDHDGDDIVSEQNGTQIFDLNIYDCCRTGDAVHVTYSALMTLLFVFISALLLER